MIIQKESKNKKKYYYQYHLAILNHHKLQDNEEEYIHKSHWVLFVPLRLPSMQYQSAYTNWDI